MGNKKTLSQAKKEQQQMRVTVYFGYGLFLLMIISFFISVSPWFRLFHAPAPHPLNITIIILTLFATTIVPLLAGYIAGDKATRVKSRTMHHYNGVLFGALGLWVGFIFSALLTYAEQVPFIAYDSGLTYKIVHILPVVLSVVVLAILGVFYAKRTRYQAPIIAYASYQKLFVAAILVLAIILLLTTLTTSALAPATTVGMSLFIVVVTPVAFLLALVGCGYWALGKKSSDGMQRLIKSLVAASFAVMGIIILGHLAVLLPTWQIEYTVGLFIITLGVWGLYLYLMRRAVK